MVRPSRKQVLAASGLLLFSGTLEAIVKAVDWFSRGDTLLNLPQWVSRFQHPLAAPILICGGFALLVYLHRQPPAPLYGSDNKALSPIRHPLLKVSFWSIASAVSVALLVLISYAVIGWRVAERRPIRIVGYHYSPLVVGKKVVITVALINEGPRALRVSAFYRITYVPSVPANLTDRKAMEDFVWADVMRHPPKEDDVPLSVPTMQLFSVPNGDSDGPLSEAKFKGMQEGGAMYLMGSVTYASDRPPLTYCVYQQMSDRVGVCVDHNN